MSCEPYPVENPIESWQYQAETNTFELQPLQPQQFYHFKIFSKNKKIINSIFLFIFFPT